MTALLRLRLRSSSSSHHSAPNAGLPSSGRRTCARGALPAALEHPAEAPRANHRPQLEAINEPHPALNRGAGGAAALATWLQTRSALLHGKRAACKGGPWLHCGTPWLPSPPAPPDEHVARGGQRLRLAGAQAAGRGGRVAARAAVAAAVLLGGGGAPCGRLCPRPRHHQHFVQRLLCHLLPPARGAAVPHQQQRHGGRYHHPDRDSYDAPHPAGCAAAAAGRSRRRREQVAREVGILQGYGHAADCSAGGEAEGPASNNPGGRRHNRRWRRCAAPLLLWLRRCRQRTVLSGGCVRDGEVEGKAAEGERVAVGPEGAGGSA